jgi:hypothetical protein
MILKPETNGDGGYGRVGIAKGLNGEVGLSGEEPISSPFSRRPRERGAEKGLRTNTPNLKAMRGRDREFGLSCFRQDP